MDKKAKLQQQKEDREEYEANVKDFKFCAASFVAILIILGHYAFIMRQWVINPQLSYLVLGFHFSLFLVTIAVNFYILGKVIHPKIYSAEDLALAQKKTQ